MKILAMGASAVVLTACDDPQEAAFYENVGQCIEDGKIAAGDCEVNQKTAAAEHLKVAPKYASAAECETDFGAGKCEVAPQQQTTGGGSVFMPMMMGYMMGSMLGSRVAAQPLYRSADDPRSFRTANNHTVSTRTGLGTVPAAAAAAPQAKLSTVSRGGFGATAARMSGGVSAGG